MSLNLVSKIITSTAAGGLIMLGLSASPLWADNPSEPLTPAENFTPCWKRSNQSQTYQQHQQWRHRYSSRMGPRWQGNRGWGEDSKYTRMYDPNNIETISGKVVTVYTFTPMGGMSNGLHVRVRTDNETIDVHLGPVWYLENQDIKIEPNDRIEVKGSRISLTGQPSLIAGEIKKGEATLILRDTNGFPVWSGRRKGQF